MFIQNTEERIYFTDDEYGTGMGLAVKQHANVVPDFFNYKAEAFKSFMFQQNVLGNGKPLDWWKSQADLLNQETLSVVQDFYFVYACYK